MARLGTAGQGKGLMAKDERRIDLPQSGFYRLQAYLRRWLSWRSQRDADEASKIVAKILAGIAMR